MTRKKLITAALVVFTSNASLAKTTHMLDLNRPPNCGIPKLLYSQCLRDLSISRAQCEKDLSTEAAMFLFRNNVVEQDLKTYKWFIPLKLVREARAVLWGMPTRFIARDCLRAQIINAVAELYSKGQISFDSQIQQYALHDVDFDFDASDPAPYSDGPFDDGPAVPAPSNECGGFAPPESKDPK